MTDIFTHSAILNVRQEVERRLIILSIHGSFEAYEKYLKALRDEYFDEQGRFK